MIGNSQQWNNAKWDIDENWLWIWSSIDKKLSRLRAQNDANAFEEFRNICETISAGFWLFVLATLITPLPAFSWKFKYVSLIKTKNNRNIQWVGKLYRANTMKRRSWIKKLTCHAPLACWQNSYANRFHSLLLLSSLILSQYDVFSPFVLPWFCIYMQRETFCLIREENYST